MENDERILIDDNAAGRMLAQNQKLLRETKQTSLASVVIFPKFAPGSQERVVIVRGGIHQVMKAFTSMFMVIQRRSARALSATPYVPDRLYDLPFSSAGGYLVRSPSPVASPSCTITRSDHFSEHIPQQQLPSMYTSPSDVLPSGDEPPGVVIYEEDSKEVSANAN